VLDRACPAGRLEQGSEVQRRQEGAPLSFLVNLGRIDELHGVAEQNLVTHTGCVERTDADEVQADVGLRPLLRLAPAHEQLDVRALRLQGGPSFCRHQST
jgi:hypothetical protein